MKKISTNKGIFNIRYAYESYNPILGSHIILVIEDKDNAQPFTGKFGDEIPMVDVYKQQYDVKEIK